MKTRINTLFFLLLLPVLALAEDRPVSGFHGISFGGSHSVTVRLGSTETLRIEGDQEDIDRIETVVENGILKIRNKRDNSWSWNSKGVKIYVTAKALDQLSVSGSGSLEVADPLKANTLNTSVSGSGSLRLTAAVRDFNSVVSGSGSISLGGSATHATISLSGSGGFRGEDFKVSEADIRVSGSGSVRLHADKSINARLSGSGSVRYSGDAEVNAKNSGSGRVRKT